MKDSQTYSRREKIGLSLRLILAVILLLLLFHYVDIAEIGQAFARADASYLLAAFCLVLLNLGLQMAKWRYFVRLVNPGNSNLEIAASLLFGISLGTVTPGQLGEFGGRTLRHRSLPAGSVLGLTLVDKLQMMCIMAIGGVTSIVVLAHLSWHLGILLVTVTCLFSLFLFFGSGCLVRFLGRIAPRLTGHQLFKEFFGAIEIFTTKHLLISLLLSVSFYCVLYAQMFLLLNAFQKVSTEDAFLGFAAMMFTKSLLPISFGDLGIREATAAYFFSLRGIAESTSVSAALLLFAMNILLPSLGGLFFMPRFHKK